MVKTPIAVMITPPAKLASGEKHITLSFLLIRIIDNVGYYYE